MDNAGRLTRSIWTSKPEWGQNTVVERRAGVFGRRADPAIITCFAVLPLRLAVGARPVAVETTTNIRRSLPLSVSPLV